MRKQIQSNYDVDFSDYIITKVNDNEFVRWFGSKLQIDSLIGSDGITILYQMDPSLKPKIPENPTADDSNHGIAVDQYVRMALELGYYTKGHNGRSIQMQGLLPRIIQLSTEWTLKQVHQYIFKYLRQVFVEWLDWKDPETQKRPRGKAQIDLRTSLLVDFPYRPAGWDASKPFTMKDFKELSDEEAFVMIFPGLMADEDADAMGLAKSPYRLSFKNTFGIHNSCEYCGKSSQCRGCKVPFSDEVKVKDILEKINQSSTNSYYN